MTHIPAVVSGDEEQGREIEEQMPLAVLAEGKPPAAVVDGEQTGDQSSIQDHNGFVANGRIQQEVRFTLLTLFFSCFLLFLHRVCVCAADIEFTKFML